MSGHAGSKWVKLNEGNYKERLGKVTSMMGMIKELRSGEVRQGGRLKQSQYSL